MRCTKKQGRFLDEAIDRWEREGVLTPETAGNLRDSYSVRPFDWGGLAKYSFLIAVLCGVIAFSAAAMDEELLEALAELVTASDAVSALLLGVLSGAAFRLGFVRRKKHPERVFSNEAVLFAAVLLCAGAVVFLGRALDSGTGRYPLLFLLAAVLYGVIGAVFGSALVWVFALLSLGGWLGAETGYVSGWGAYYYGMSYPLRFLFFGGALIAVSLYGMRSGRFAALRRSTFKVGLLALFLSLWVMSIFGNYSPGNWRRGSVSELFFWSAAFGLAALGAVYYGLKRDDGAARGFGLTFFFINLYTKYFEYFWDDMHKAAFFLLLAASFWLIGRKAESIWNLDFLKEKAGEKTGEESP